MAEVEAAMLRGSKPSEPCGRIQRDRLRLAWVAERAIDD
jgi:hypothetical protein